jgi:2-keto-4-pentenoate hydratase/2-oxohepta-3-ene-1,7-dioic acid hydratase in catechol pathway
MKLVKFTHIKNKKFLYGKIEGTFIVPAINSIFDDKIYFSNDYKYKISSCKFYLPIKSSKIIGVAQNYKKDNNIDDPLFFLKSNNSLSLTDKKIKIPKKSKTWGESELAFVIKKKSKKNIPLNKCKEYILGYTIANDITTSYNNNNHDHHLALSKSLDNYCPIANFIDTNFNYKNKIIEGFHNGSLIRRGNTSKLILKPYEILSHLSSIITLYPGDLILTGAPPRMTSRKYLKKNDSYQVKISNLGSIITTIL